MVSRRHRTGPLTQEDFEKAIEEEISISREFNLPVSVLMLVMESGWESSSTERAMAVLRAGDLIRASGVSEMVIALPNTSRENARIVERRLRDALPEVRIGLSVFEPDDTPGAMLDRARGAVSG